MFERYTEKARRVIFFARYEASQFGAAQIEAEAKAEIDAALATASAAPWPEKSAAYTDIMTTGEGVWA